MVFVCAVSVGRGGTTSGYICDGFGDNTCINRAKNSYGCPVSTDCGLIDGIPEPSHTVYCIDCTYYEIPGPCSCTWDEVASITIYHGTCVATGCGCDADMTGGDQYVINICDYST